MSYAWATIRCTPIVRLNKLAPPRVNVFVKIEAFNAEGTVKDRLAPGISSLLIAFAGGRARSLKLD